MTRDRAAAEGRDGRHGTRGMAPLSREPPSPRHRARSRSAATRAARARDPGLVGDPLFAVLAVVVIGVVSVVATLAYVRLTARRGA